MAATPNRAPATERMDASSLLRKSGKIEPMLLESLNENPWQPRLSISPNQLEDLKKSIQDFGFIGYIPVRRSDPDDPASPLEIVYGHRRVMAARMLGQRTIPVMLCDLDDEAMMRLAFVENSTHKKMTYWEEALHFQEMRDQLGLTVRKLAEMLGLSRNYVHSRLMLLNLPDGSPLRVAAERNDIAMANALVFANLSRTLEGGQLERLLDDVRKGEISLDDLQALEKALVRASEIAEGELDDDGKVVHTVTVEDQRRLKDDLVEAARRKELRTPKPAQPGLPAGRTRVEREAAAAEERRAREAAAASIPASTAAVAEPVPVPTATAGSDTAPAVAVATVTPPRREPATTPITATDAPRDGLRYARETVEQLRGVLVHLRPRAEKADFTLLPAEERVELVAMRAEIARLLGEA